MSRLDAVVRVLKATGKALHYDIITRQALQQGIIRFTGSQGTAGESMKVSALPAVCAFSVFLSPSSRRTEKETEIKHALGPVQRDAQHPPPSLAALHKTHDRFRRPAMACATRATA
jgi:hypothetical protein